MRSGSRIQDERERSVTLALQPNVVGCPITFSLSSLSIAVAVVCGITVWASMYGLNNEGYDFMVCALQEQAVTAVREVIQTSFQASMRAVQAIEEQWRLWLQQGLLQRDNLANSTLVCRLMWNLAKQLGGLYMGLPNGDLAGYLLYGDNVTVASVVNGRALLHFADSWGRSTGQLATMVAADGFDVVWRPGYVAAVKMQGLALAGPVVVQNSPVIGFSLNVPLFDDLEPPVFSPLFKTENARTGGSTSSQRSVLAVFAAQLQLKQLSELLARLQPNGGSAWVFTGSGDMVASSNVSVCLIGFDGVVAAKTTEVDDEVINTTMAFILRRSGLTINDSYAQYERILTFFNEDLRINETRYVVFCKFVLRDASMVWFMASVVPRSVYFKKADEATITSFLIMFLVIVPLSALSAILLGWKFVSKPMVSLANGMDHLARFADTSTVEAVGRSSFIKEISLMQLSYSALKVAVEGFAKFAPVHIVKTLLSERMEASLGVQETEATCLFSDIKGFTSIAECTAPWALIEALGDYFTAMSRIVVDRRGVVGDFIGDAVFAFWNTPKLTSEHALLACDAAVEQLKVMKSLRQSWRRGGLPLFEIRIGVHTGRVLAGNIGSPERLKYTLIGDTVNLASRLEELGKSYHMDLVVSEATYDQPGVRDMFVSRALDVVTVIGRTQPTTVLTLTARRVEASLEDLQLEQLTWKMIALFVAKDFTMAEEALVSVVRVLGFEDAACQSMMARIRIGE